jgi:hypothetical protein
MVLIQNFIKSWLGCEPGATLLVYVSFDSNPSLKVFQPSSMSLRRIVSGGDVRVVVQEVVHSGPTTFAQFDDANATFVDKSLAIEAFLRERGGLHLVLRPRRCGKSYTLSMIRLSFFLIKYRHLLMQSPSGTSWSDL